MCNSSGLNQPIGNKVAQLVKHLTGVRRVGGLNPCLVVHFFAPSTHALQIKSLLLT